MGVVLIWYVVVLHHFG